MLNKYITTSQYYNFITRTLSQNYLSTRSTNPPFPPPTLLFPNTRQDKNDDYVPKVNNGFHQENIEQDAPRKGSSQASGWQSPRVSKLDRPCHR